MTRPRENGSTGSQKNSPIVLAGTNRRGLRFLTGVWQWLAGTGLLIVVVCVAPFSGTGTASGAGAMQNVNYRVEIELDANTAWTRLSDFSLAINYVPGLTDLKINSEQTSGVGASRTVTSGGKLALDETIIDWREGEGFTIRLHRGDNGPVPPMTEAYFDYGLEVEGDKVYLHNSMRYKVGLGFLGRFLDWLAINRVVSTAIRDTTIAQKLFYETGKKVDKDALAAAKKSLSQPQPK